jgi:16S rRNA A1518/A1519 N6-dimethyltransferase RsmA/KsgA/DIM1 with predicted DNA glycosylase/AP lyase activity
MKTRNSGMPEQNWWESFFDPPAIFDALDLCTIDGPVVDVGCGHGTFTVAMVRRVQHPVIAVETM